jgi:energy-converting hydrogenase Eha subunit H
VLLGLLAIVSAGLGLAFLILADTGTGSIVTPNLAPRTTWRLKAILLLAGVAGIVVLGLTVASARL